MLSKVRVKSKVIAMAYFFLVTNSLSFLTIWDFPHLPLCAPSQIAKQIKDQWSHRINNVKNRNGSLGGGHFSQEGTNKRIPECL